MCCPCVCATINIVFKEIFNKLGENILLQTLILYFEIAQHLI